MELIDKKPLLISLVDWQMSNFTEVGHEREFNLLDSIIKCIENEPTVEAKEIVHGEWIDTQHDYHNGFYRNAHVCSNCNDYYTTEYDDLFFCPRCGADMRTSAE